MDTGINLLLDLLMRLESWAGGHTLLIAAAGLALAAVSTLASMLLARSLHRARRRYQHLMRGPSGQDLDVILVNLGKRLEGVAAAVAALERRLDALEQAALQHVQHVGVVRFSAFAGTGADLSFAIALLDGRRNGLVLSSLYGRDDLRAYAKPIVDARSTYPLTAEEEQAIQLALRGAEPAEPSLREARTG